MDLIRGSSHCFLDSRLRGNDRITIVIYLGEFRLSFDLEGSDLFLESIEFYWLRSRRHLYTRSCFIDEIDRLIRQATIGDIFDRELDSSDDRPIRDADTMECLIAIFETSHDGDTIGYIWLIDSYWLESTLESRIFFYIFSILIQRSRSDHLEGATSQ